MVGGIAWLAATWVSGAMMLLLAALTVGRSSPAA